MITLDTMQAADWADVKRIYEEGIQTRNATFETTAPEWEEWNKRHVEHCRIIAKAGEQIVGWAALTPVSTRRVYAGVTEVSVYVTASARGKGVGKQLLQKLIEESEANNVWTLQASIFPENIASIQMHLQFGFRIVGEREKIGKMHDKWRDTVLIERRSKKTGAE